jgi:cyclohexa-1,5-dienecarbonyl-CoA hydratase
MERLKLSYTHEGAVANIVLDNGKGNVLDNTMMLEMLELFAEFRDNKDIKLITFQGEGKHFSFGASVEEHRKEKAAQMLHTFHKLFYAILDLKIPTAAKVSGQCLGGGLELALICNFIFADSSAKFGQPEINLGVFPPPASLILPLKIGNARAEELLITGKTISADRAKEIGLVNEVYADRASLDAQVALWIEKHILPKSASSLKYATSASRMFFGHIIHKFLPELENDYVNGLMNTKDANEGIEAFIERRDVKWENC